MIPLGDSEASRRLAPVNTILIAANIGIFGLELRDHNLPLMAWFALMPARISHLHSADLPTAAAALVTLVSSLFLHGGLLHIAGNMLYLLVFGPAVEGRLGHRRFILFYFTAGIISGLATVAMAPQSPVPSRNLSLTSAHSSRWKVGASIIWPACNPSQRAQPPNWQAACPRQRLPI